MKGHTKNSTCAGEQPVHTAGSKLHEGLHRKNLQCTEEGEFTELFLFLFLLSDT